MTYIGNARSLLIVGPNTRDDLVSTVENQVTFELSQEVPGGYESNVTVLRQKYIIDNLITNNNSITVDQAEVGRRTTPSTERLLQSSDSAVRAALSVVKVGDIVKLSIPSSPSNSLNDVVGFPVKEVVYTGDTIKIYLQTSATGTVNTSANDTAVSITLGSLDNWEVLEPERQYTIGSANGKTNKYITLTESPKVNDKVYVLHKGEATYNFVPTAKSVGPDQLTENLRNFRTDRYTATGDTTEAGRTFAITATEDPEYTVVDARSLLVTVDGETLDCDGKDSLGQNFQGAWKLNSDRDVQNRQTITFHVAPAAGKKIRILNLGFSTVSRRASFSLGQATTPGQGSVGEDELKNDSVTEGKIRDGAVTTPKIRNNAVNGTKILLENDELLRSKTNTSVRATPVEFGLLKLGSTNITELFGDPELSISIAGTKKVSVNATEIYPETTDDVSLGTLTKRFKNLALSGNITVSGTVDGVDVSTLKSTVDQIKDIINTGVINPIGTIMIWTSNTIPDGWLRCNGAALNTYTHRELHKIISNTFNASGVAYQAGVTDIPTATGVFYLPDLITRFPVGATSTGDFTGSTNNLGTAENPQITQSNRSVLHSHSGPPHTHTFSHTHNVPGHYHTNDLSTQQTADPEDVNKALHITSSGKHTTRIDHGHTGNTENVDSSGNQDNITWTDTGAHTHSGTTDTCISATTTAAFNLDHTHRSWPVNAVGPWYDLDRLYGAELNLDHSHNLYGYRSSAVQADYASIDIMGTDSGSVIKHDIDGSRMPEISSGPDTDRTRNFTLSIQSKTLRGTPSISAFTTAGSGSLNHRHTFSISSSGAHKHIGGLSMTYKNIDSHPTGSSAGNDLRGVHVHGRSTIVGRIGLVSGSNGNSPFSTLDVNKIGGQDPTTSNANYNNAQGVPQPTGNSVSPHLVVHFIIKATNPQVT